jgi:hypothetical protein
MKKDLNIEIEDNIGHSRQKSENYSYKKKSIEWKK